MLKCMILTGALLLSVAATASPGKFTRLYNGKDLSGWHVESGKLDPWKAEGDLLVCEGPKGGYLAADREYGDFELRLEYRLSPGANSGVGIRFPRGGWPSTMGMEIQLLDDAAAEYKDLKPIYLNGSIYSFVAPSAHPAKPAGEWNRIVVRCKGPMVDVTINDTPVQHVSMAEHTEKGKGDLPLSQRPRKGLVGLQSHTSRVEFRNIEIKEL